MIINKLINNNKKKKKESIKLKKKAKILLIKKKKFQNLKDFSMNLLNKHSFKNIAHNFDKNQFYKY